MNCAVSGKIRYVHNLTEIEEILKGEGMFELTCVYGDLTRSEDCSELRKITTWEPIGVRASEKPKNRFEDQVIRDIKIMRM